MQKKTSQSNDQNRSFALISVIIFGGLILVAIIWSISAQYGAGFQGKTLWDWLDLLLVPILIILLIPGANWVVRRAQERHARLEREITLDDHREKALQYYMELMTDLILERGLGSQEGQDE